MRNRGFFASGPGVIMHFLKNNIITVYKQSFSCDWRIK